VFVPHQLLNQLVDFMKFGWEVSQIFNPVAAAILKWLTETSKVDVNLTPVNAGL
jgi:hypothetical protein